MSDIIDKQSAATGTILIFAVFFSVVLNGCEKQRESTVEVEESILVQSAVLATVNGEPITEEDVYNTIDRTFSESDQLFMNEDVYGKVLESLIASKAMVQEIKKQMSADEIAAIENKVKAYEEELYIKEYLTANAVPEPVTTQMVEDYYKNNPEKFGGATVKVFEQLSATRALTDTERDRLIADQGTITANPDWQRVADNSNEQYPLSYKRASALPGLLVEQLDGEIKKLKPGQASRLIFVNEVPTLLRVIEEKQTPAKPLYEVSTEIRKTLAPIQLRKAVKKSTEEVLEAAEVQRFASEN